jgi:hypothetical protein
MGMETRGSASLREGRPMIDGRYRFFLLARRHNSWQKLLSLRVKKEFIFNPADGGQENLGKQRNGGC